MKLTQTHKDAFVRAVLDDLPSTDNHEEARKLVTAAAVDQLPATLRAVWDDPKLRTELVTRYQTFEGFGISVPGQKLVLSARLLAKLQGLREHERAQSSLKSKLRDRLYAVIRGCSTLKQAKDALPEFEKYLPAEPGKTPNLPAVHDVVEELKKAGWPKGAKK